MRGQEVQDFRSGVVGALMARGREIGGWRIPVPGRLPGGQSVTPQRGVARRREAEFRRDLHHFLAAGPIGQPILGGK